MPINIELLGRKEHPGPPPQRSAVPVCQHADEDAELVWFWVRSQNPKFKPRKSFLYYCHGCGRSGTRHANNERRSGTSGEARCREIWGLFPDTVRERDEARKSSHLSYNAYHVFHRDTSKSDPWWNWYSQYLESTDWWTIRKRVMDRDQMKCRGCGERATQVHHLTYARVGYEHEDDLVAVCHQCHEEVHA